MSNTWNEGYQREEAPRAEAGDCRVEILNAEAELSKSSGKPMIVLTVRPNNTNIKIKHYLVKNEYFNRNATQIFDSFNIDEGDFNLITWTGAVGAAKLVEDNSGYLKVKYFIPKSKQDKLPPWIGEMPERSSVIEGFGSADPDDDLPF